MDKNKILILCKVVDNFGDIGVVYRLAKSLSVLRPGLELTLVVSNLESFSAMASQVDSSKQVQDFFYKESRWKVIAWDLKDFCERDGVISFKDSKETVCISDFGIILECFQCGRPEWLENIIFSDSFTRTLQILNIDYLTAEEYADDFHLLRSGTRKANIKKRFFMPGFTEKTGGLIFSREPEPENSSPKQQLKRFLTSLQKTCGQKNEAEGVNIEERNCFDVSFFAYERNCLPVVEALMDFEAEMRAGSPDFSVCVYLAAGKSHDPFMSAYKKKGSPFKVVELPFLQQEEWDKVLAAMDFNFVRGEESLSRAALLGIPFVWHAYIQDEDYQLVKVNALLERMEPYFDSREFSTLKDYWNSYNESSAENFALGIVAETPQRSEELQQEPDGDAESGSGTPGESLKKLLHYSVAKEGKFRAGFKNFSEKLISNGDLSQHLLDFIDGID